MAEAELLDSQTLQKPRLRQAQRHRDFTTRLTGEALPPNPCLVALLLVARSGTGPRIVIHYPPCPSTEVNHADVTVSSTAPDDVDQDGQDSDPFGDLSDDSDDEKPHGVYPRSIASSRRPFAGDGDASYGAGDAFDARARHDRQGYDTLFGHSVDNVAGLMAPKSHIWHHKRLEASLDGRVLVGCPTFKGDDGQWKNHRRPSSQARLDTPKTTHRPQDGKVGRADTSQATRDDSSSSSEADANGDSSPSKSKSDSPSKLSKSELSRSDSSQLGLLSTSTPSDYSAASSNGPTSLSMFNVVAVLSPPSLECPDRVDDIFRNVIRALATILRRLQHKRSFVEHQAHLLDKIIGEARMKGRSYDEAWHEISAKSALARALATTFKCISQSRVAHLSFKSARSVDSSIQIPHQLSTSLAAELMSKHVPGLSLSSASFTVSDHGYAAPTTTALSVSPHCALILVSDNRDKLVRQMISSHLTAGKNTSKAMAYFIRHVSPRKTLLQFSRMHHIPLGHVLLLALQLIRWRFARPISPLHATSTFVVSPNAHWGEISNARQAFARRFPTLPEMMAIFSKLNAFSKNGNPLTWANLIPSTDHKDAYMDVLAWLVQGGWLYECRTFAWIRVSGEVKRAVSEIRKKELEEMGRSLELETAIDDSHLEDSQLSEFGTPERRPSSGDYSHQGPLHPRHHLHPPPVSDAGSTASNRTTIRLSAHLEHLRLAGQERKSSADSHEDSSERASHPVRSGTSRRGKRWSLDPEELDFEPSLIHEPTRLNTVQQRWVRFIGEEFRDERLRVAWPRLIKYFDGEHALEEIAVVEGWKRKVAAELLTGIIRGYGCLQTVRHW